MSSRIHKIAGKYNDQKPAIKRARAVASHTRNARRSAQRIQQMHATLKSIVDDVPNRKVPELRDMAKNLEISGYSKMKKADLISAIIVKLQS